MNNIDKLIKLLNNLIKRFPQRFQTYSGIADRLSNMVIYDLSDSELKSLQTDLWVTCFEHIFIGFPKKEKK